MKADGTGLLWTTTLYGIGIKNDESYNAGIDIQVNNTGDDFFAFQSEYVGSIGLNNSALILGPHPVFPANPALGDPTGDYGYALAKEVKNTYLLFLNGKCAKQVFFLQNNLLISKNGTQRAQKNKSLHTFNKC